MVASSGFIGMPIERAMVIHINQLKMAPFATFWKPTIQDEVDTNHLLRHRHGPNKQGDAINMAGHDARHVCCISNFFSR